MPPTTVPPPLNDQTAASEFERRVAERIAAGQPRQAATRSVCRSHPELRVAFVREHNRRSGRAQATQQTQSPAQPAQQTQGPAAHRFHQLVAAGVARGLTRQTATREAAVNHPEAHRSFLAEYNAGRDGPQQRNS